MPDSHMMEPLADLCADRSESVVIKTAIGALDTTRSAHTSSNRTDPIGGIVRAHFARPDARLVAMLTRALLCQDFILGVLELPSGDPTSSTPVISRRQAAEPTTACLTRPTSSGRALYGSPRPTAAGVR